MSKARIAINGFGRTGRSLTRQIIDNSSIELIAINNRSQINYGLLAHDSVYGKFNAQVKLEEKTKSTTKKPSKERFLHVNKHVIAIFQGDEPIAAPWKELDIDIVVDATGNFPTFKGVSDHLEAGAKNVVMTYPPKDKDIKTIIIGVNNDIYVPPKNDDDLKSKVLSSGSSSTLALAPILKYLDAQYGIVHANVLVSHAYTDSQNLLDNSNKDSWRCRAAPLNIIPTTTGAQENIPPVLPGLEGKVTCMANRVPVAWVSQLFVVAELSKDTTSKDVNDYFESLAQGEANGVLDFCKEDVCSSYFRGDQHNAVIDHAWTSVNGKWLRMIAWFDNEWGYASRLIALLEYIAKKNKKWF